MPDHNPNHDARIAELEITVTYQQRLVEQLNDVLCSQTQQLLKVERTVAELKEHLREVQRLRKDAQAASAQEKPPHY